MINGIIELLNTGTYYRVSERVDIAKGKYKTPNTWKELGMYIKRKLWQTRK